MAVDFIEFLLVILLLFGVPLFVGIFVYRDSVKRGMNAPLWTLIAMCGPSLLGLILYLLIRRKKKQQQLTCPNCNTPIEEAHVVCPNCRTRLRPSCSFCGTLLQRGWKVCPRCGTDAP